MIAFIGFIGFVTSEDFCQVFKGRNGTISYLYMQGVAYKSNPIGVHHIIIDGKYWDLEFDSVEHTVGFDRTKSHTALHFTDQYMGAVYCWKAKNKEEDDDWVTFLLPKENYPKWFNETRIPEDTFDRVRNLDVFSKPVTRQVLSMNPENNNYRFAMAANLPVYNHTVFGHKICRIEFIKEIGTSGKQFIRYVYIAFKNENSITSIACLERKEHFRKP